MEERILYACRDLSVVVDREMLNTCERNPCCSSVRRMPDIQVLLRDSHIVNITE